MREMKARTVPTGKMKGCSGVSLIDVIMRGSEQRNDQPHDSPRDLSSYYGVVVASDGLPTEPISWPDMGHMLLLSQSADGTALARGGPLRLWSPPGIALQKSGCGDVRSPDVKGVVCIRVCAKNT